MSSTFDANRMVKDFDKTANDVAAVKQRLGGILNKLAAMKASAEKAAKEKPIIPDKKRLTHLRENAVKKVEELAEAAHIAEQRAKSKKKGGFDLGFLALKKLGKDDKSRSLYERLGGDLSLETAVDMVYSKAVKDYRTRAYFEKNPQKMAQIKKKMQQFLGGFLGGRAQYDEENLKPAHYYLNVTDYHFDAVHEMFKEAFQNMGVHPDAVRDGMQRIGQARKDITAGCTVRMAVARRNIEFDKGVLWRRLGGIDGFELLMDKVYELVARDARLKLIFKGYDIERIKRAQTRFIGEALGAPKQYQGMGVDDDSLDQVMVTLEGFRSDILGRQRGLSSAAKLVEGKSILDRVGGQIVVESIVETMFSGILRDPRVLYFFTLNGLLIDKLKETVVAVNPYATTFCPLLQNLTVACELNELDPALTSDIAESVAKVRPSITMGCTVRLELARKRTESAGTQGLWAQVGGLRGLETFIDRLYECLQDDDRVKHFFTGSKLEELKKNQSAYLMEMFGGPSDYNGRDLPTIHANIRVSDFHFDTFQEIAMRQLRGLGLDPDAVDECMVLLETVRDDVVNPALRDHDVMKVQQAANRKPLYDRIGGERAVTRLVDELYGKALTDDRLRSFFEKNKAKVQSIKKKMAQYICGAVGGPSAYDVADMKPAHYAMNITSFHFDAVIEILRDIMGEMDIPRSDAAQVSKALQGARENVCTGFIVRTEVAKRSLVKGADQMFRRLGESEGLTNIFNMVYSMAANDQRIKHFFEKDVERIKQGQLVYTISQLGGPKAYSGRDLLEIHRDLGVTDYHFDCFIGIFGRALQGAGIDDGTIDEALITLEPLRRSILGRTEEDEFRALAFKDGESMIERIGGDMNLETFVEFTFQLAVKDDRIRYYFDKSRSKLNQIEKRFYQYLSGVFGGPVQYNSADLKPAHYDMNLTNFHFDAFLEAMAGAAEQMELPEDVADDAIVIVNRVRTDVTTGYSIRHEVATRRTQVMDETLYQRLGGADGLSDFVNRLYEVVERDKRINNFFGSAKLAVVRKGQTEFLSRALGASEIEYKGRSLEEIHSVLSMTDYHLDSFLNDVSRALKDLGQDDETVDEVIVSLEQLRGQILKTYYIRMGYQV